MATDVTKMSFAKVAAGSVQKGSKPAGAAPRTTLDPATTVKDRREEGTPVSKHAPSSTGPSPATSSADTTVTTSAAEQSAVTEGKVDDDKLAADLRELKLETSAPNLVVNGSTVEKSTAISNSQTPPDDASQRAESGSELGTKPPSIDGKSITSGTTFALDEKDSLRPDDSASMKAAAEDDDSFSIRGSYIPGSRMGSDVAARLHRIQIGDMPPRALTSQHMLAGDKGQGIVTPQSGISDKQGSGDQKLPLPGGTATPDSLGANSFYSQNPDEKLLEAMQSPKDRIFLLRLEQQVIQFVQDSKEPYMDLPPCNSFCRMLTHRLADYYHMTHSYEPSTGSVRIFRTPFCRIPPSLSTIAGPQANNSAPTQPIPRKIMRRGEDGEFAPPSTAPSKPTSEVGSESKDKPAPVKEK